MCICINCEFYRSCWIHSGIYKIPKNFLTIPLHLNSKDAISYTLSIKVILNKFMKRQHYEFDVAVCEGFCEKPGNWINENF
jgi:hypothetical protein